MADLCGPSNGLSNFQKHTAVDRTLQQDRLVGRQSPSQGFRSSGPNTRQLDSDFEAFQAGNLPLGSQDFREPPLFAQQQAFQPGPVNWASDFQRLNISAPQQGQLQHGHGGLAQEGGVDWNLEFSRQQNQMVGGSALQRQQQQGAHLQRYTPAMGMGVGMGMGMGQYSSFQAQQEGFQAQPQVQQPMEQFDDAAFERAFQEAANVEIESHTEAMEEGVEMQLQQDEAQDMENLTLEETLRSTAFQPESAPLNQPLLGADIIRDPNKPEEPLVADPDALARTAQNLVNSLSGDTRSKMQGSEFMKLMRGFASGAQVVRGDDVVGASDGRWEETLDREQQGNEESTMKDILRETFTSISQFSEFLQATLLDPQRPFTRSPASVRVLLLTLLHLDAHLHKLAPSPRDGLHVEHKAKLWELKQRVEGAVCSNSLNGLPSVRILAIAVLKRVQALLESSAGGDLLEASDKPAGSALGLGHGYKYWYEVSSLTAAAHEIQARQELQASERRGILDDVVHANRQVCLTSAISRVPIAPLDEKGWEAVNASFERFQRKYRGVLSVFMGRERQNPESKMLLQACLGYKILGEGEEIMVNKVHLQRVADIMGHW